MKSILLLIFSFGLIGVALGQEVLFSENFENYTNDQNVSPQSPFIDTWSGGSADDALISQEQANSGSQSLKIANNNGVQSDLILPFDNFTTGTVEVEFFMYVPEQSGGYFNFQKTSNPGEEWAFEVYIGDISWHIVEGDTAMFDFPFDTWNKFTISVNLDTSIGNISLNDNLLDIWIWTSTPDTSNGLNQLGGINLFADAPFNLPSLAYYDDITATFTEEGTVNTNETDLKEAVSIYPNPASEFISISLKNASSGTATILNSSGKAVMNKVLNSAESILNISNLNAGLYLINIDDGKKHSTKKVIIH